MDNGTIMLLRGMMDKGNYNVTERNDGEWKI